jgi:hypothetical protein
MKIVVVAGNDLREFSLNVRLLALKIVLERNTGDQKRLRLFSFFLNVLKCYLINILDGRLCWK